MTHYVLPGSALVKCAVPGTLRRRCGCGVHSGSAVNMPEVVAHDIARVQDSEGGTDADVSRRVAAGVQAALDSATAAGTLSATPTCPRADWQAQGTLLYNGHTETEYLFARTCCNALLIAYKIAEPVQCQRALALLTAITQCAPRPCSQTAAPPLPLRFGLGASHPPAPGAAAPAPQPLRGGCAQPVKVPREFRSARVVAPSTSSLRLHPLISQASQCNGWPASMTIVAALELHLSQLTAPSTTSQHLPFGCRLARGDAVPVHRGRRRCLLLDAQIAATCACACRRSDVTPLAQARCQPPCRTTPRFPLGRSGCRPPIQHACVCRIGGIVSPDVISYNSVMEAMGAAGRVHDALSLLPVLRAADLQPSRATMTLLMSLAASAGLPGEVVGLWADLVRSGLRPETRALNLYLSALISLVRSLDTPRRPYRCDATRTCVFHHPAKHSCCCASSSRVCVCVCVCVCVWCCKTAIVHRRAGGFRCARARACCAAC